LGQTPAYECVLWLVSRKSCNADRLIDALSASIAGSADVKPEQDWVLNADTCMQTMKDFGMQESQKICIICLAWKSSLEGCGVVVGKWSRLFSGALPHPLFDIFQVRPRILEILRYLLTNYLYQLLWQYVRTSHLKSVLFRLDQKPSLNVCSGSP
jgi:hypothetical protein